MLQYLQMLRHIRDTGNVINNERTGVGTISVFGYQMRFDLRGGKFPLVTTKRLHLRSIIHELLWMISGSTNNEDLVANGVSIWDEWAVKDDVTQRVPLYGPDLAQAYADKKGITLDQARTQLSRATVGEDRSQAYRLLDEAGVERSVEVVTVPKGSLGPVYGQQWRAWKAPDGRTIDQLQVAIDTLKANPGSRRIIVSAWNPADLPEDGVSPEDNAINGRQALAACHCMFQFRTRALSIEERIGVAAERGVGSSDLEMESVESVAALLDSQNVPKYALSCALTQRSADALLGVPFNIASYALLTHMVAQVCNMVADELVWHGGDVHLYSNHLEKVDVQLAREPYAQPRLELNRAVTSIDDFTFDDIRVVDYKSHPAIKAAVAK